MTQEDKEIYEALKYNANKKYWYYIVSTNVRRSGEMKVSIKKYNLLKKQYEMLLTQNKS